MNELIPPAFILFVGAGLIGLLNGYWRVMVVLCTPILTFLFVWQVPDGVVMQFPFLSYMVEPIEGSPLRRLFATIFTLVALIGGLFSFRQAKWYELASSYAYAACAIGISFSGDLIVLFIYWELMVLFSTMIIWCGGTSNSRAAGMRYAIMHLLGGVILQVGIIGIAVHSGSIDIRPMLVTNFDTWMIFIGILINAAAPPFSAWLADSYPESTSTGSVFLSAFTTKSAVLTLILLFPGENILIWIGIYMIMYGIIYALLENDTRRILSYSIVNQVGLMVCAVGIGSQTAINGAAAHAFSHIIYKSLLLMSAGVVIYRTGKRKCTDLGGLFRTMPLTTICGIFGALSISGFPLTIGFSTKLIITHAVIEEGMYIVYFILTAASAGVFLHAGIKFPWFVFFQKDSGLRPKDAPWNMGLAMVIFSTLCIIFGMFPEFLYHYLPYPMDYITYKPGKVLFYLQLLLFSGFAFFIMLPLMQRTLTISLDVDWLWRFFFKRVIATFESRILNVKYYVKRNLSKLITSMLYSIDFKEKKINRLFCPWLIGTTTLVLLVLFSAYLLIAFFILQ